MKDKPKSPELVQELCQRLKAQFEGLGLDSEACLDPEAQTRLAKERTDELKRKLLMEVLKQQLGELSR